MIGVEKTCACRKNHLGAKKPFGPRGEKTTGCFFDAEKIAARDKKWSWKHRFNDLTTRHIFFWSIFFSGLWIALVEHRKYKKNGHQKEFGIGIGSKKKHKHSTLPLGKIQRKKPRNRIAVVVMQNKNTRCIPWASQLFVDYVKRIFAPREPKKLWVTTKGNIFLGEILCVFFLHWLDSGQWHFSPLLRTGKLKSV